MNNNEYKLYQKQFKNKAEIRKINQCFLITRTAYLILLGSLIYFNDKSTIYTQFPSLIAAINFVMMILKCLGNESLKDQIQQTIFYQIPIVDSSNSRVQLGGIFKSQNNLKIKKYLSENELNLLLMSFQAPFFLVYSRIMEQNQMLYFITYLFNSLLSFQIMHITYTTKITESTHISEVKQFYFSTFLTNSVKSLAFSLIQQWYLIQLILSQNLYLFFSLIALVISFRCLQKYCICQYSQLSPVQFLDILIIVYYTIIGIHYEMNVLESDTSRDQDDLRKQFQVILMVILAFFDLLALDNYNNIQSVVIRSMIQILFIAHLPYFVKMIQLLNQYLQNGPYSVTFYLRDVQQTEEFVENAKCSKIKFNKRSEKIYIYSNIKLEESIIEDLIKIIMPYRGKILQLDIRNKIIFHSFEPNLVYLSFCCKEQSQLIIEQLVKNNYFDYEIGYTIQNQQINEFVTYLILENYQLIPSISKSESIWIEFAKEEILRMIVFNQQIEQYLNFSPKQVFYDLFDV